MSEKKETKYVSRHIPNSSSVILPFFIIFIFVYYILFSVCYCIYNNIAYLCDVVYCL